MRRECDAVAGERAYPGDGVCDWGEGGEFDEGGLGGAGVRWGGVGGEDGRGWGGEGGVV